ncbi:MAG: Hydroxyacylglutathione hydrolase GloC [Syntrophus sp. SKADARSKE-3]|nr:Hydroxyacylglutathione hydrolase GloC [Syntrophus sp. SKADARSKE-3]
MKFRDDIYVYEWTSYFENNCNSFYIGGSVKALIDPGLLKFVPDLLIRMADDGIELRDIRYIINTHSHPDHFEGSEFFCKKGIDIALHDEELRFLQGPGGELYELFGLEVPVPQINLLLKEGELKLGDEMFQVIHVPGHSPGSIALYSPSREALFPGDVIFDQSMGRTDFPGGSGSLLKESIKRLSLLEAECLLPGHMGIVDGGKRVKQNFQAILTYFSNYF